MLPVSSVTTLPATQSGPRLRLRPDRARAERSWRLFAPLVGCEPGQTGELTSPVAEAETGPTGWEGDDSSPADTAEVYLITAFSTSPSVKSRNGVSVTAYSI